MTNAKEIVTAYQRAIGKGDMAGARKYLRDDLAFVGPFDTFHRPAPYLEALGKLHHIDERVEPKKFFVDGEDEYILYEMVMNPPAGTASLCEWYRHRRAQIAPIQVFCDP